MAEIFKIPLVLRAQPEGGYTVTSPALPELLTEGDTLEEAVSHVQDALAALVELYDDLGKPFPANLQIDPRQTPLEFEGVITHS
jgi:antitoxin HicB